MTLRTPWSRVCCCSHSLVVCVCVCVNNKQTLDFPLSCLCCLLLLLLLLFFSMLCGGEELANLFEEYLPQLPAIPRA